MHSLTIQWCVKYWHAAYTLVSSPCWCLGWETWNRPGKLAASSVNVAEIWVKPTARLASGTSETPQGHQRSTRIRSVRTRVQRIWPWRGRHTYTYIHMKACKSADSDYSHILRSVKRAQVRSMDMPTHILNVQLFLLYVLKDTDINVMRQFIDHASLQRHKDTAAVLSYYHRSSNKCHPCLWMSANIVEDNEQYWWLTWFPLCPEHSASQDQHTWTYMKRH